MQTHKPREKWIFEGSAILKRGQTKAPLKPRQRKHWGIGLLNIMHDVEPSSPDDLAVSDPVAWLKQVRERSAREG